MRNCPKPAEALAEDTTYYCGPQCWKEASSNEQHSWRESRDVLEQFQPLLRIRGADKWYPEMWNREWVSGIPETFDNKDGIDDWSALTSIEDARNQIEADLAEGEPHEGMENSAEV